MDKNRARKLAGIEQLNEGLKAKNPEVQGAVNVLSNEMIKLERMHEKLKKSPSRYQETGVGGKEYNKEVMDRIEDLDNAIKAIDEALDLLLKFDSKR